MARMPRLVVPGYPHHVTQRGNRRMKTFFHDDDYRDYLSLLAKARTETGVAVWAYCLMPNHVHLVVVPQEVDGLARLFRFVHQRYSRRINLERRWRGHLWQERFHSCVMDERHLLAAVRYTELNPVRAGLTHRAEDWPWSSTGAHLHGRDDAVVSVQPMLARVTSWRDYLAAADREEATDNIRGCARTGRPAGDAEFIETLKTLTGCTLKKRKPGPGH